MATAAKISSSNLSIKEIIALKEAGFEPIKYVFVKTYLYDFRNFSFNSFGNQIMQQQTDTLARVRSQVISELEEEAAKVNADGIIDVSLKVEESRIGFEVTISGTAIRRLPHAPPGEFKKNPLAAFSSNLSAFDFWNLIQAGYKPVSICYGACIYHFARRSIKDSMQQMGKNVELVHYTQALYNAREYAMEMMQNDALTYSPAGILNVKASESQFCGYSHALEFVVVGTSVKPLDVTRTQTNINPIKNFIQI